MKITNTRPAPSFSKYLLLVCLTVLLAAPATAAEIESNVTLNAHTYLDEEMAKGPYHTVDEKIENDGFFNSYRVTSPFGTFSIHSNTGLRLLIHELQAIAEMQKVETTDVAIESLKKSGENTVTGVKNLFSDPEKTLQGAASGVQSLFGRAKGTIGRRHTTEAEDSRVEQLIGLTKSKGNIAVAYGVSIYSRNAVLQKELDRLAQADYLGGISVGLATSAVSGLGGVVLTTSGTARLLNEVINTTPASELWLKNKNMLLAMEIDEDTAELFLNNPVFDPALMTIFVGALDKMKGVDNRDLAVKVALQASDFVMAKTITETAAMLSWYHSEKEQLTSIALLGRLFCGIRKNGAPVVTLSADYMTWNDKVAALAPELNGKYSSRGTIDLYLTGRLSETAKKELHGLGWATTENVRIISEKNGKKQ